MNKALDIVDVQGLIVFSCYYCLELTRAAEEPPRDGYS